MRIEPIEEGREIGAEVHGIDLGAPLSTDDANDLRAALFDHLVLVFRDQDMSAADQVRVARALGDPSPPESSKGLSSHHDDHAEIQWLSYLGRDGSEPADKRPSQADIWHTDYAYLDRPPELAMLGAVELHPGGPDTLYADMRAAFEALPQDVREELEGLRAIHNERGPHDPDVYRLPPYAAPGEKAPRSTADRYAVHPLVRRHPVTGRASLYMASSYTTGFEGVPEDQGRALLDRLYKHATAPPFTYRHVWREGDALLWDNTSTNHRRSKAIDGPRVLHRVSISLEPRAAA
jgi:alpha-ketoglutarate-dependent taurine dioxygenase